MITKNELVAIIAALSTDFDAPPAHQTESPDDSKARNDDTYMMSRDEFLAHRMDRASARL